MYDGVYYRGVCYCESGAVLRPIGGSVSVLKALRTGEVEGRAVTLGVETVYLSDKVKENSFQFLEA